MSLKCVLADPLTGNQCRITSNGRLVAAPLDFSVPAIETINASGTAFNLIRPAANRSIIITGIFIGATRSVNNNGVVVELYEASSETTLISNQGIIKFDLPRHGSRDLSGLNLIVPPGEFVNVTADSNDVEVTVNYYRAPIADTEV